MAAVAGCGPGPPPGSKRLVRAFEKQVQPILKKHCLTCHGEGENLQGGLDVRNMTGLLVGGVSGPAVVLGQPEESLLVEMISLDEMPPEDVKLSNHEKSLIRNWLKNAAQE